MNEERTWTGNSEVDAAIVMLDRIDCSPEDDSRVDEVEATLRHLHARVQELEAMLEAVGAGGVSAQRVTQGKDHITQPRKMVAAQEPFGYFKAEPFGWRDCAETDEGAIALYEAPQPQAGALDAERWSEIGKSIERACGELPEDFEITIHLENGAGTVVLLYPNGEECENFPHDDGFAGVMNAAIDAAIAAHKEKTE